MRTDDGSIIQDCLNGKPEAFGMLVDKYKEGIYAFIYAELRNSQDAQDVTQEVFLRAYRDLRNLRRWDSFAFWLYRIAHRQCALWFRNRSKRVDCEFIEDQDPKILDAPSLSSYQEDQLSKSVREALDTLPKIYREVLMLHYFGGMNSDEIAKVLGTSPTAIRMRLSRARAQLREEMVTMMGTAFEGQKLRSGFTFRVVEAIKHIKINPVSTIKGLPWGISLATGLLITVLSINPALISFDHIGTPVYSPLPVESRVLKVGEIPVDVVKTSNIAILSNEMGKGKGGEPKNMQNSFFMAPKGEGGTWTKKADMPNPRFCFTVAVNGKIYAIGGGTDPNNILSKVEEYDPVKETWEKKANMPTARFAMTVGVVNGKIYAIGGVKDSYLSIVEEYDPEKNIWARKADMPTARGFFSGSVVDGKIYAFGGVHINASGNAEGLSITEEYDPVTNKWTKKADMLGVRSDFSASTVNGKIYVIGGYVGKGVYTAKVEEYNPLTDTWIKKTDMPTVRKNLCTSVINGKIYAIGGINKVGEAYKVVSVVEEYDPVMDKWTEKANLSAVRHSVASSVVDGKIYAIGGFKDVDATIIDPAIEEYTPEAWLSIISPQGKLPKTWGNIKSR